MKHRFILSAVTLIALIGAGAYAYHLSNNLTPELALTQKLEDVTPGMAEADADALFGKPDLIEEVHRTGIDMPVKRKTWKTGKASVEVEFIGGHVTFKHARTQYDFPKTPTTQPTTR